jgi:RNA polymerase sigma-70 factor (ECF subfamily)
MQPTANTPEEQMVGLISRHQVSLHDYIFTLLRDASLADDVLQETNLVLCRKASEYDSSLPFLPWARTIAWYQVKAAQRNASRDKLVFSDETMHLLSGDISESVNDYTPTHDELTLALCISKLTDKQKKLVNARYLQGLSVANLSDTLKRPVSSISQALYVIRNSLKKCVGSTPS